MTRFAAGVASIALLAAVGAGLGTYFGLRGVSHPRPPTNLRWSVLDAVMSRGLIRGYRAAPGGYRIAGAGISVGFPNACGNNSCPALITPILQIEYEHNSESQGEGLANFARSRWNGTVKTFEVTIP